VGISLNDLVHGNQRYAEGFTQGDLVLPPARKLAAIVCMDARIDPLPLLGLHLGDIHVIRNAGGRVTEDVLRSLAISERLLGTDTVMVVHHTDCGMLTFSNGQIRDQIKRELGDAAYTVAEHTDFLPFGDLAQSVKDDVAAITASPLIPDNIAVFGVIYDVHSGRLTQVE